MPTAPINGSASPTNTSAFSGWNPIFCWTPVPLARPAANGVRYAIITGLRLWGGNGGTIGLYAADSDGAGYASSGGFGSVASGAWDTGWRTISKGFAGIQPGWEMRVGFTFDPGQGSLRYGRHAAGGNIMGGAGVEWTGASLSGEYGYIQQPAAPSIDAIYKLSNGKVRVEFNASPDNGDSSYTSFGLQYAQNPSFVGATTIGSDGTSDLTLAPGPWWFRAASNNYVSDWAGISGPWSAVETFDVSARGRRWTGTQWASLTTAKRWNGSNWVDLTTMKRWNGSQWVDLSA